MLPTRNKSFFTEENGSQILKTFFLLLSLRTRIRPQTGPRCLPDGILDQNSEKYKGKIYITCKKIEKRKKRTEKDEEKDNDEDDDHNSKVEQRGSTNSPSVSQRRLPRRHLESRGFYQPPTIPAFGSRLSTRF